MRQIKWPRHCHSLRLCLPPLPKCAFQAKLATAKWQLLPRIASTLPDRILSERASIVPVGGRARACLQSTGDGDGSERTQA
eukprot:855114-Pleurochrysis_carterae.AAC.1